MLGAGAVAVMGVRSLLAGNGSGHSEEELVTEIYTGEEEECEEEPELTLGERIAHSACGICMSAVGQADYEDMLRKAGLYGETPGKYTWEDYYGGGGRWRIHNHIMRNASYVAQYVPAGVGWEEYWANAMYFPDAAPNTKLPNAQNYIDWTLGKDVNVEGAKYIPEYQIRSSDPEIHAQVVQNRKIIPSYATFTSCGAVPGHMHWSYGLDPELATIPGIVREGGGNTATSGTSMGVNYVAEAPGYDMYWPDHILGKGSPVENEQYYIWSVDKDVLADDQLEPGDFLYAGHMCWSKEPADFRQACHLMLYVGNDIVRQHFPESNGNFVEAGAENEAFAGVTYRDYLDYHYFVARPKDRSDLEMRQWVPPASAAKVGCGEPCRLKLGERISHTACAIAMTAVGQDDYAAMLRELDLYGTDPGRYTWTGAAIANHTLTNPEWVSKQDPAKVANWVQHAGCAWAFEYQAPDPRIPRAQTYIDFTMGKGVDPQYGTYIPEPVVRNPEFADLADYNRHHLSNLDGVPGYARFCMCGTAVQHVHWAHGSDFDNENAGESARSNRPGCSWESGTLPDGTRYLTTGSPHYLYYFPDHMACKDEPYVTKQFLIWTADPTKTFAEQCEPGDLICYGPPWGAPEPADFEKREHGFMYVGNDIVRQYFPNSHGAFAEAGGGKTESFWSITRKESDKPMFGSRIFRPIDRDTELRQWVPKIAGCDLW